MKKLFLAILLSIGIALSGCAGTMKDKGMVSTIPNMEYVDVDFFADGNITKIPSHIRANAPIWHAELVRLSKTLAAVHFSYADEKMTWVVNVIEDTVLLVIYGKADEATDEAIMEFYIYDGKMYPTKTTEAAAKAYMKLITDNLITVGI